jgi:predicted PurR-regulated permease PerM
MTGFDARAARAAWTVFVLGLGIYLAYVIRRTILIFIAAVLFAYLLSPLVDLVDRLFPRERSRNISLAVVYLILLAVLVSLGGLMGSTIAEQAANLAKKFPDLVEHFNQPSTWPLPKWLESRRSELVTVVQSQLAAHSKDFISVGQKAGLEILKVVADVPFLVLVPILSFFILKDGARLRRQALDEWTHGQTRELLAEILRDVHVLMLQYMRAIVILCVLTFVAYMIFFLVMGVPYALLLAAIGGSLEFIPFLGPLSAAVIIILVSLFSGYTNVLWLVLFFLAWRMCQDYVVSPYLMSEGIELHPLLVILGILAGEQIGGIPGMFLSIPVLAILRVLVLRLSQSPSPVTVPQ